MDYSSWKLWTCWIGCILNFGLAASSWGQTAVFIQGVSEGGTPNTAYQTHATTIRGYTLPDAPITAIDEGNWGGSQYLEVGTEHDIRAKTLLRFPIASLATQLLRIQRARLTLSLRFPYTSDLPQNEVPSSIRFELYRVRPANVAWVEGDMVDGSTQNGCTTWAWLTNETKPWAGGKRLQPGRHRL